MYADRDIDDDAYECDCCPGEVCIQRAEPRLKLTFFAPCFAAVTFETLQLADLSAAQLKSVMDVAYAAITAEDAIPTETTFRVVVNGVEHEGLWLGEYHLGYDPQARAEDE